VIAAKPNSTSKSSSPAPPAISSDGSACWRGKQKWLFVPPPQPEASWYRCKRGFRPLDGLCLVALGLQPSENRATLAGGMKSHDNLSSRTGIAQSHPSNREC